MLQPDDVNSVQWKAIVHSGSHLLIVAGPGTGKTHTLTYRIARLAGQIPPEQQILAITFTNKAAEEMRSRLAKRFLTNQHRVTVGTFHSVCLDILKTHHPHTTLPHDFRVASEEDIGFLMKTLWPDRKVSERHTLLEMISRWKSLQFQTPLSEDVQIYDQHLRNRGLVDFDDLLLETFLLFENQPDILRQIQNQYHYVFVDEYQDINAIQHVLLKRLVTDGVHITAIGDPNQAIYGFRGSDVRYFVSFKNDFPGAETLTLSENYRSAANILTASSQIMNRSQSLHVPELTARIYTQGRLTIHSCPTDKAEAEYVVHQIEKMVGGTSMFSQDSGRVETHMQEECSFGDIAVLYRLNSQRRLLQKAFDRSGIPYHIVGQRKKEEDPVDYICPVRNDTLEFNAEKISFMTIHSAKGLEFPVVFILGCEASILPLNLENLKSDIEEERRLFYVGMTRAKDRLFLIRAKRRVLYGKTYENQPSPFLADIEEDLKEYEKFVQKKNYVKKHEDQLKLF